MKLFERMSIFKIIVIIHVKNIKNSKLLHVDMELFEGMSIFNIIVIMFKI